MRACACAPVCVIAGNGPRKPRGLAREEALHFYFFTIDFVALKTHSTGPYSNELAPLTQNRAPAPLRAEPGLPRGSRGSARGLGSPFGHFGEPGLRIFAL